jgi:hypothetical protein
VLPSILDHVLPSGEIVCGEYVSINPTRNDQNAGSFRINLETGKWADFATGDFGGDPASLIAYLSGSSQVEAARWLRLLAEWFPHPHHPSPGPWRQLPLVTLLRPCSLVGRGAERLLRHTWRRAASAFPRPSQTASFGFTPAARSASCVSRACLC